jgi:hypothetical protein
MAKRKRKKTETKRGKRRVQGAAARKKAAKRGGAKKKAAKRSAAKTKAKKQATKPRAKRTVRKEVAPSLSETTKELMHEAARMAEGRNDRGYCGGAGPRCCGRH